MLFEERPAGRATARCVGLGEVGHLRAAGIEPNHAGLKANVR